MFAAHNERNNTRNQRDRNSVTRGGGGNCDHRRALRNLAVARIEVAREYRRYSYAAVSSSGSTIDGSSFSGLFTRVEIGYIRIGAAGKGRIKSRGSLSSPNQLA